MLRLDREVWVKMGFRVPLAMVDSLGSATNWLNGYRATISVFVVTHETKLSGPKAWLPHLRFLFYFWFVFVVGVSLSLSLFLSLSLSLWCRSPRLCVQIRENTRGWPTRRRPQLSSRLFLVCFLGKSIGQCPGQTVLSRTVGAPPTSSRSPLK